MGIFFDDGGALRMSIAATIDGSQPRVVMHAAVTSMLQRVSRRPVPGTIRFS
jgi:hypothetical protein